MFFIFNFSLKINYNNILKLNKCLNVTEPTNNESVYYIYECIIQVDNIEDISSKTFDDIIESATDIDNPYITTINEYEDALNKAK